MPWRKVTPVSERQEFITLASVPGANVSELCRRFGISRKTGNKWLARYRAEGMAGLADRSRRPHRSPRRTTEEVEKAVTSLRAAHPAWGGRKLRARLVAKGQAQVPAASTITAILDRNGLLADEARDRANWKRFEHELPNKLWQMDFKGHFGTAEGRCHPLTVLDDHSRYAVCLRALADERAASVQSSLIDVFRRYGLPERILADNGSPWGDTGNGDGHTVLTVWLLRLGIKVSHGRPYHPQTQGKEERFHKTLKAEVLRYESFRDLTHCQMRFDTWRDTYNLERPHEALSMAVPASRYKPSWREFPETLPPIEYGPEDVVRLVSVHGKFSYRGRLWRVGKAFAGMPIAIRATTTDGTMAVYFCRQQVTALDLRNNS